MARGIRFCRTFLHVARVKNLRLCTNRVRCSHGRRFFDSPRNVQNLKKCDTNHISRATAYEALQRITAEQPIAAYCGVLRRIVAFCGVSRFCGVFKLAQWPWSGALARQR